MDRNAFMRSLREVLFLTTVAFLPMVINVMIALITSVNISSKILPGEMLSYCLSFLAPSIYIIIKTHGTGYKLPILHFFSLITFIIYVLSFVLYVVAKNSWVASIDMLNHNNDGYFKLALTFLIISVLFRIYSVYHGIRNSNWNQSRRDAQIEFNADFVQQVNGN